LGVGFDVVGLTDGMREGISLGTNDGMREGLLDFDGDEDGL